MSNQLDNLFKNKLQNRSFDYDESSWHGARLLIEQDEKKRKRDKWFMIFGIFLLLSIFGSAAFYAGMQTSTIKPTENTLESSSQKEIIADDRTSVLSKEKSIQENTPFKIDLDNSTGNSTVDNSAILENANNAAIEEKYERFSQNITPTTKIDYLKNTNLETDYAQGVVEFIRPSDEPITANYNPIPITTATPKQSLNEQRMKPAALSDIVTSALAIFPLTELHFTPSVEKPLTDLLPELTMSTLGNPMPVVTKKWSFGLRAGTALLPLNFTDFETGLIAQYQLNRNFAISIQPHYVYQQLDNTTIRENEILEYGFGLRTSAYSLQAESIRSIHTPIMLSYSFGNSNFDLQDNVDKRYLKNKLSIGVSYIYLDGVTGSIHVREAAGVVAEFEKGWLDTSNFNRHNAAIVLGYERFFTKRFSVGLMARYRIRDQFSESFSQQNPTVLQPQPFYIGLQAYYKLN